MCACVRQLVPIGHVRHAFHEKRRLRRRNDVVQCRECHDGPDHWRAAGQLAEAAEPASGDASCPASADAQLLVEREQTAQTDRAPDSAAAFDPRRLCRAAESGAKPRAFARASGENGIFSALTIHSWLRAFLQGGVRMSKPVFWPQKTPPAPRSAPRLCDPLRLCARASEHHLSQHGHKHTLPKNMPGWLGPRKSWYTFCRQRRR